MKNNKIFRITEEQYKAYVHGYDILNEVKQIATKSNITVASLEDFKDIINNLNINDNNVEQYLGKYCFIEVGSSLSRLTAEVPHIPSINDKNGKPYSADMLYKEGQWGFGSEHKNVLKLEFDDNQKFNNKFPKQNKGFDGNTPTTAVKLSSDENIYGKNGFTFYYENGADFTNEMASRLKQFVDYNLSINPNVKFVIHCKQGKSRSAAIGMYVAKKVNQFTDEMLSEYDIDNNKSQFNIGMSAKGQPKYPHKNVMTKMGEIEGWSNPKKDTKEQWFYNTLVNHPNTGYNAQKNGKTIKVTEEQYERLTEDVFANAKNDKKKTAQLTYQTINGNRNKGNLKGDDFLKTDKMDKNNTDTYEVPLKGGIMSYNITSINGTEVMHYFKRIFADSNAARKTTMKLGNDEYELNMKMEEFRQFMDNFNTKVDNVVEWKTNEFKQQNKDVDFVKVSVYPVPSSSNFNVKMAEEMAKGRSICGLPIQIINTEILRKDTSNLQKDEEFIQKNQAYYNSQRTKMNPNMGTHNDAMDTTVNQLIARSKVKEKIEYINQLCKQIITSYNNRKTNNGDRFLKNLSNKYQEYCEAVNNLTNVAIYFDTIAKKEHKPYLSTIAKALKYSKGSSIEKRTGEIYDMIKSSPYGKWLNKQNRIDVCFWENIDFQIKKLGNDVRMGLKNYFQPNYNNESEIDVQEEINKTHGSVVVIFDDNVSGGATLADICLQLKNLGIEYLIPITFGQMRTSWNIGKTIQIQKPEGGFNM